MILILLLIFCTISNVLQGLCYGQTIINIANGVYSTKAESEGLHLSSSSTFKPIDALTIQLYLSSSYSVFVNYQITISSSGDFWSKLQISRDDDGLTNAGSLVHYGNQAYKTATGYWVDNLEPGHYTFEVHYKSSSSISMAAGTDYQTAILQVMWLANAHAVSDGVRCYPNPYPLNGHRVLSPMKDLKVTLITPTNSVVLAGYQLPIYSSSQKWFITRMHQNNQQLKSTSMVQGYEDYLNLNSLWMKYVDDAEYEFGLTYFNEHPSYFEDCRNNYQGNKNLYAMYLPTTCRILATKEPTTTLSISTTNWMNTDLSYTFTLNRAEHIIVRYHYSSYGGKTHTFTRLYVDSVQQQMYCITGNIGYAGNSGLWQGALSSGKHTIIVQIKHGSITRHSTILIERTRAMDIIRCY